MKKRVVFFLLFILSACYAHAQRDTLTREQLVGDWNGYMIMDTTAYFATPDSLKIADSLGIDILHFKMLTFHFRSDGTVFTTSEYMESSMHATWTLQGDTIVFVEDREKAGIDTSAAAVVVISLHGIQFCYREVIDKKVRMNYVFMEKVE